MFVNGKDFAKEDTHDKITIADSFVLPSNKLGKGNVFATKSSRPKNKVLHEVWMRFL